ncbi:hypothetical protein SAY87_026113 [Trapa incisa]|uniref:Phytocyanin domain-containing protein n=1 Tax=Trapa incisa TaxID=236973 RepID=A0AAN7GMK4_9MYRT|nr:hypothetical protein SAY87_026113 [Trapa incisa]
MASPIITSALVLVILLLTALTEAREILVGGKTGAWKIPTSEDDSLNSWAASSRFRVGDSLVWKYDGEKDSVLKVTRDGYLGCNTTSPIEEYDGGNNTVKLERSGAHYFISGAEGHCQKGEKLIVVVLSQRYRKYTGVSPAPSPSEVEAPAIAPSPITGGENFRSGRFRGLVAVGAGIMVLGFILF